MELPIDHFRLLGVSPTTDSETVLRTLQQRLDRAPDQGFTVETLQARAELLQASAELLSDEDRRHSYERELTAIADTGEGSIAALEIPPSREVGGLLLLMEAGQAQEAFEAASRGLQPPQAPALGSSREADLSLVAGLACQAAAADFRNQRRYEAAARTLQQGLQLLQRMGQLPDQRRLLEQELKLLLPYRVLDLISRDLSAITSRQEGIRLLEQLVLQRGGLEGELDSDFPQAEFQPFFKQIRQFLTVQEQVDLFSRWAEAGSATADFLASFALTAAGFVQRKPERIQAGFQRLQAGGQPGMEVFLACQQLLLGQVEEAQILFNAGADDALRQWAQEQSDDPLARLCAYCRDWLSREVLPGFRDIDADADLEAWFADRDVQAYVDQQDRIRGRRQASAPAAPAPTEPEAASDLPAWPELNFDIPGAGVETDPAAVDETDDDDDDLWDGPSWRLPELHWPDLSAVPRWALPAAGGAVAVIALGGWMLLRPRSQPVQPVPVQPAEAAKPPAAPAAPPVAATPSFPLTAPEPSDTQLQELLEAWLAAKAAVLAGDNAPLPLSDLARSSQVQLLQRQEQTLRTAGATELVKAKVESFTVSERSPNRIAAQVNLQYSDERRSSSGAVLNQTPSTSLTNTYVFARDGDRWLLAAYKPG
ncbi:MAG: IMS domain-containing protein [Vulcanococcus sp.]